MYVCISLRYMCMYVHNTYVRTHDYHLKVEGLNAILCFLDFFLSNSYDLILLISIFFLKILFL